MSLITGKLIPAGITVEPMVANSDTFNCIVQFGVEGINPPDADVVFEQQAKVNQTNEAPTRCVPIEDREVYVDPDNDKKHTGSATADDAGNCIRFTGLKLGFGVFDPFPVSVTCGGQTIHVTEAHNPNPMVSDNERSVISDPTTTLGKLLTEALHSFKEVLAQPAPKEEARFFPKGVGLISVHAEVTLSATSRITLEVKLASVGQSGGTDSTD